MATREQLEEKIPSTLYMYDYNRRISRVRPSGQLKTWKRDPSRFRLPVKFGLYESGEITDENNERFYLSLEEAIKEHPDAPIQKGLN